MKKSVRELRSSMKQILYAVQHGEEVIIYSHKTPIAKIIPLQKEEKESNEIGFGMWKDHAQIENVSHYVRQLRSSNLVALWARNFNRKY